MILAQITLGGILEKVIATLIATVIISVVKHIFEHKNNRPSDQE